MTDNGEGKPLPDLSEIVSLLQEAANRLEEQDLWRISATVRAALAALKEDR